MIATEQLSVSIGPVAILHGASLQADAGTTIGIVGHNGAGKTTLMRALVGLLASRGGRITLCGQDVTGWPTRDRIRLGIGYMPEDRRLVPDLTVRENILLPMDVARRRDGADALARVLEWIPELKILIDRRGNQLSGGQQKLAALARAICCGTKVLLLDEPFEGVAPALVERLVEVLQALRRCGPTVLISDSEGAALVGLCDRFYEIERGMLRSRDSTHA
jgi:branched-chain amino acid transport system ATP-binding protein